MAINNITGNEYSDEWFTKQHVVDLIVELLKPSGVICCPFDSDQSLFVAAAQKQGTAFYGMKNWLESDYSYDYLMTNPPFSIKTKVIEKVAKSGKPSALVLPLDAIGGRARHKIFAQWGHPAIYVPAGRIEYVNPEGKKQPGSSFHSIIMLFHTDHQGIIWEA
jgi:hypothetical protein